MVTLAWWSVMLRIHIYMQLLCSLLLCIISMRLPYFAEYVIQYHKMKLANTNFRKLTTYFAKYHKMTFQVCILYSHLGGGCLTVLYFTNTHNTCQPSGILFALEYKFTDL